MESGAVGVEASAAPQDPRGKPVTMACLRRQAWAQSKESIWQESKPEHCDPQGSQQSQRNGETRRTSEEPGQVPNKIASWLSECRTPLGASLDEQSASPSRGALRNGCSFEDDLSLGAEANHLLSSNNKAESCLGFAADQKRSQYKERGRSMNSTGSGKSSTVSSFSEVFEQSEEQPVDILLTLRVSELLDLYEEDPEEILLNLGFGREEPDLSSKIPSRFFNSTSSARGIDIKVYLKAQLQRTELENPNYALTSRFRQIEVLTTVANEFFQLYSQVSGHPVQCISSKDQGEEAGEPEGGEEKTPPLKRNNSAVAKLLKKTISKHHLLANTPELSEAQTPNQHPQLNGHAPSEHAHTNGHAGPEQDGCRTDSDHQMETVSQKHIRKKDFSLATVTEETNGDVELIEDSPEQSSTGPEHHSESANLQNQRTEEEGAPVVKEENNLTSTPEKPVPTLAPPQLAQLRTETADSFDMEEIQSNEDEALPSRLSRSSDLLRTVSQQSDSSGFAEEPSVDCNSCFKIQESSDSCDSETTVTSHPSQDVATPHALDQPAFILPDGQEEVAAPGEDGGRSKDEEVPKDSSEQIPQYTAHHLPRSRPAREQEDPKPETVQNMSAAVQDSQQEPEGTQDQSSAQEPEQTQNLSETAAGTSLPTEGASAEDKVDGSDSLCPVAPPSPVLSALNRAKRNQLSQMGQQGEPQSSESLQTPGRGRGRRGTIPLQRSSSLPSSLLSPSRVVSSVRIQFGQGHASCTRPRYSYKYTHEDGEEEEDKEEEEDEEEQERTSICLSTLLINPASSSNKKTTTAIPPKPIPRYLMRSSYSLQSSSPPPDWSPGGHAHSWSTQSVPDLSSNQQQPVQFQQNLSANQNQQGWNPGQMMSPNPNRSAQFSDHSPNPSPSFNTSPYPCNLQYPSTLHPYTSLPNLLHPHNPSLNHHSSLTSLHHPATSPVPPHGSLSNLHQASASAVPHHIGLSHSHPGSPPVPLHGYGHPYSHPSLYHPTPHGLPFASPYLGYPGYTMNPHFPHPFPQYPPLAPEHSLHPGLVPAAPGFLSGLGSPLGPGLTHTPAAASGPGLSQGTSSTEMQLRRVLHEIKGTVQSLNQNQADTPDAFSEHRGSLPNHQSLAEFQQKRRSLNLFRSQMMDLELSIIRQQALVYKHLSPADRLEVEQLQSLRSAVREELQELEQQLEDRLIELTHNARRRGLHKDGSVDSLSTTSALRAMEPMSDLLREQLFLQSELSYGGHTPSTNPSSRASSPVRGRGGGGGGDGEHKQGVYRASININPVPPPRPVTLTEEEEEEDDEEEEGQRDSGGAAAEEEVEKARGGEAPAVEGLKVDNLQQLIREIRESVAQEVRREIYSELMAAVVPRQHPL
ncbi:protein ITPRID2 isoform X2 [Parambassis ranga]|uniref:Protein ITPRID2 isoform X2 n=1 Tax=Parambassis ranga TaxID=210632 RepID=A0A6P7H1R6_9TELE|nr:protein ITPRID2 isoform X2 [Parambassis ranga]